jgi:uncharacterized damage-inducible protein DinB
MRTSELVGLLRDAYDGDPWHGPSLAAVLAGVDATYAARRPACGRHSIWELVLHVTAWTREVSRRLAGAAPALPLEGDWPAVGSTDVPAWQTALENLAEAHRALVAVVAAQPDDRWDVPVGDLRDAPLGTGTTTGGMIVGLATHHAYHAGQMAILR